MTKELNNASSPLDPAGAKIFGVDASGVAGWMYAVGYDVDKIGVLGEHVLNAGGVGVAPAALLPSGFTPLPGHDTPGSENWGNYQYADGSVMVCLPKTFYRINHAGNPTHARFAPNDIDVKFADTFASREAAALGGYALHRAFIDGGEEKPFVLVDKYKCSKQALGAGFVASSIKNAPAIATSADHNPIAGVTAASANNYAACIDAAKGRDGADGVKNVASRFFCISVFIRSLLAMHSLALAQRAISPSQAAWYDNAMATCFPKGCNNNALRDTNDLSVVYQSDGYNNCGKTGSGTPFERTTHNGQACGVADLNGLLWEVSIGMTCIATAKGITGATKANPCVLTVPAHGLSTGQVVQVESVGGMTQLNSKMYTITVVDIDTISLDGVNSTAFSTYTSGGSLILGSFFVAKESTRMRDFTSGASLATDHWGATGVAAMMDAIALPMAAAAGGSSIDQKMGNAANQVLSADTSGPGHVLTGIGHPKDASGMSTSGTDIFGKDQIYQYFRDQLCVISGGRWDNGSYTGVFARNLNHTWSYSSNSVGLRCACYPD